MVRPRLVAVNPLNRSTREVQLGKFELTVGSERGNELLLRDPTVSRRHAVLRGRGLLCELSDLKSTNGTFINDRRIEATTVLNDGDHVRFGAVEFVYLDPDAAIRKQKGQSSNFSSIVLFLLIMYAAGYGLTAYIFNHRVVNQKVSELVHFAY
jgi:pSer/pThr/pTyr-binding forkhead associated (FHA) protein